MPSETQGAMGGAAQGASMGAAAGPWGALIGGVAGAAYGWWNARSQSEEQASALREQMRRLRLAQGQKLSAARAIGAASGVEFGSQSLQTFLSEMQAEFDRQAEWLDNNGTQAADATRQVGTWNALSDLGSSMFQFGESNKWWRSSPSGGR